MSTAQAADIPQEESVTLNFVFFDNLNPLKHPRSIGISRLLFNGPAQDCRHLFSDAVSKEFKCYADNTSISFWRPMTQLSLDTTALEGWTQCYRAAKDFCTLILLPRPFKTTLEGLDNPEIVHLVVEAESATTGPPYKKRNVLSDLRHEPPPQFEKFQRSLGDLAFSEEENVPDVVRSPTTLPAMKRAHRLSNSSIIETTDHQTKKRRLELLPGSSTIYISYSEPGVDVILPNTSDFRQLMRTPNVIVADKTSYIEELDRKLSYQYMFLRPRRWGKSTFLQTLATYYDKGEKDSFNDIFGQLYIGKRPTLAQSSLLILLFDFSSISVLGTRQRTESNFDRVINTSLRRFLTKNAKFLGHPNIETLMRGTGPQCLERVLTLVDEKGEKLFVGVDEYDSPANSCLFSVDPESRTLYEKMAELLKSEFFAIMKQACASGVVQKYWLTGVLPAFRDGVSHLNTTEIISMSHVFNGLCGLTDDEVHTIAETYLGTSQLDVQLQEIKRWFNGYRFCHLGEKAATLYNPHQVFTHLAFFRSNGRHLVINEEFNATHSSTVLDAVRQANPSPDFFLDALQNRLSDVVMQDFGPGDLAWFGDYPPSQLGNLKIERLARTLLYYFGVFSFDPQTPILRIPNATMTRFVGMRLRHYHQNQAILEDCARNIRHALASGTTRALIELLEKFLQDRPVRSASDMNESAFQVIIEAIFVETGPCLPELCLVVDPAKEWGDGRYGFIDLFLAAKSDAFVSHLPVLELKNVSLKALWNATQPTPSHIDPPTDQLGALRSVLINESEEEIMRREYCYWDKDCHVWRRQSLLLLKDQAVQQVGRYLDALCQGGVTESTAGLHDRRVNCRIGNDVLVGYVVFCIGATRVLAWRANSRETKFKYI